MFMVGICIYILFQIGSPIPPMMRCRYKQEEIQNTNSSAGLSGGLRVAESDLDVCSAF